MAGILRLRREDRFTVLLAALRMTFLPRRGADVGVRPTRSGEDFWVQFCEERAVQALDNIRDFVLFYYERQINF